MSSAYMKDGPDGMVLGDTLKYRRSDYCSLKIVFPAAGQTAAVMD